MKAKVTAGLFNTGVLFLFTPTLWNHFQNERLRILLSSPNVPPLEAYTRFAARTDAHGQLAFWAIGIVLVLAAFLSFRRFRPA
jgi:ABC-type polysaccharide/polyol phosphate export permease